MDSEGGYSWILVVKPAAAEYGSLEAAALDIEVKKQDVEDLLWSCWREAWKPEEPEVGDFEKLQRGIAQSVTN